MSVVTDPYAHNSIGLPPLNLKADVVTISHESLGHAGLEAIKGSPYVLRGAGEYEIGGVFITGIPMHNVQVDPPQRNIAYSLAFDNLTVLHLGDLSYLPDQSTVENLDEVNVLLLPVGAGGGLKAAQAAEVVALIEPHFIVPMHYELPGLTVALDSVDKFMKAMGVSKIQEVDTLKVAASDLPEQPQVVLLRPQTVVMA
jgi:L-ascorbate metabolism protein UlaG (beta-lactamase superfamily)